MALHNFLFYHLTIQLYPYSDIHSILSCIVSLPNVGVHGSPQHPALSLYYASLSQFFHPFIHFFMLCHVKVYSVVTLHNFLSQSNF